AQTERLRKVIEDDGDVERILDEIEAANEEARLASAEAAFRRWIAEYDANRDPAAQTPMDEAYMTPPAAGQPLVLQREDQGERPEEPAEREGDRAAEPAEADEEAGAFRGGGGRGGFGRGRRSGGGRGRPWGVGPAWAFLPEDADGEEDDGDSGAPSAGGGAPAG